MASYNDIKSAAARIREDRTNSEAARHLADITIALCDRLAELEARQHADVQRLENWFRNMRQ